MVFGTKKWVMEKQLPGAQNSVGRYNSDGVLIPGVDAKVTVFWRWWYEMIVFGNRLLRQNRLTFLL
jgi:hypothetical protein